MKCNNRNCGESLSIRKFSTSQPSRPFSMLAKSEGSFQEDLNGYHWFLCTKYCFKNRFLPQKCSFQGHQQSGSYVSLKTRLAYAATVWTRVPEDQRIVEDSEDTDCETPETEVIR